MPRSVVRRLETTITTMTMTTTTSSSSSEITEATHSRQKRNRDGNKKAAKKSITHWGGDEDGQGSYD